LLTGRPGVGKSTVIKRVVDVLGIEKAEGFWSAEMREENRRVGFEITTLSGHRGVLAHVDIVGGPRVSKYGVNVQDIESVALPALERARESNRIIVIDEIASMELCSPHFAPEVRRCLDACRVLATLQQRRGGFLDEIRAREDIVLLDVTLSNRDQLPKRVLSILGDEQFT
ncbi:MAG: NTPase, partial [Candidatus Thorarchaeota archaeon]